MAASNDIILYNYAFSPFGKRITAYLALRGIEYALCVIVPKTSLNSQMYYKNLHARF
jgi:hypothetical protein